MAQQYIIVSGVWVGPVQVLLAAANDGTVGLQLNDDFTPNLYWSMQQIDGFLWTFTPYLFPKTILAVAPPPAHKRQLSLQLVDAESNANNPNSWWSIAPVGENNAVRTAYDSENWDWNLNIFGNPPWTAQNEVGAYDGWSGGQPNEVWSFSPIEL